MTAAGASNCAMGDGAASFHWSVGQAAGSSAVPMSGVFKAITMSNRRYMRDMFANSLGCGGPGMFPSKRL